MCAYVAAGVAWVSSVVVTAPTDLPAALASSSMVGTGVPLSPVQLLMPLLPLASLDGATAWVSLLMAITSLFILTPVV
ncbi:hypothetical protein D3C72_810600 [compost metagenome]